MFNTVANFTGKYNLTQLSTESEDINLLIDDEERRVLNEALGHHEFRLLENDLDIDGNPVAQKYIDLIEGGVEYTVKDEEGNEHIFDWGGVKQFLKGFAYYKVVDWQRTFNTGSGEKELFGTESGKPFNVNKVVRLRNDAAVMVGKDLRSFTSGKRIGIVEVNKWYLDQRNYEWYWQYALENTLFNYMLANMSDFPKWTFNQQNIIYL